MFGYKIKYVNKISKVSYGKRTKNCCIHSLVQLWLRLWGRLQFFSTSGPKIVSFSLFFLSFCSLICSLVLFKKISSSLFTNIFLGFVCYRFVIVANLVAANQLPILSMCNWWPWLVAFLPLLPSQAAWPSHLPAIAELGWASTAWLAKQNICYF